MRKVAPPEGAEFSHEDHAAWESLTIQRGQIVEADLNSAGEEFPPDLWGGFLVTKVELGLEGDMILHVKSLGCDDPDTTRSLSTNFNRRAGCLHLCHSYPCEVEGDFTLHISRLRLFSPEGFAKDYMTHAVKKQLKKWLDHMGEEDDPPSFGMGVTGPSGDDAPWEHLEPMKPLAKAHPPRAPGEEEGKVSEEKRKELRKRLEDAKAKMSQEGVGGAGPGSALPPGTSREFVSPEYSPSPLEEEAALNERRKSALRDTPRRSAKEIPAPEELDHGGESRKDKKEKKKRKAREGDREDTLAIRDTSTGSLQVQLLSQAAKAAQEKAGRLKGEKEKAKRKDPGALLMKLLQQAAGGNKKKKKKKKRKEGGGSSAHPYRSSSPGGSRKRKKRRNGDPGSSPSSSSGSGRMSGSGESSSENSDVGSSSSAEDLKMEPPLRKRAREKPGSVLQLLVEHARMQLDQSAKVIVGKEEDRNYTTGVKLSSYFSIIIRPQVGTINGQVREMHLLSSCMDALREGALDHVGDLLAARFISLHQSLLDGNWTAARQLELLPLEEVSAAGPQLVLQARKQAKLAAKVSQPDQWYPQGAGKGRGSRGKGSGWPEWQGEPKGKTKKGGKGKGKNRPWWGQNADGQEPDPNKKKEKQSDK